MRLGLAATALGLLVACSDLGPPEETTVRGADLLPVGIAADAPPPSAASFWIRRARTTTVRLVHADGFNSPYVEVEFPAGSVRALDGTLIAESDSVLVSLTPDVGGYGLTVSPAGLEFTPSVLPTARFVLAAYGDLSVADGSTTYAGRTAYAQALTLWVEVGIDLWERVAGSGLGAGDIVAGRIARAGRFRVAALR